MIGFGEVIRRIAGLPSWVQILLVFGGGATILLLKLYDRRAKVADQDQKRQTIITNTIITIVQVLLLICMVVGVASAFLSAIVGTI